MKHDPHAKSLYDGALHKQLRSSEERDDMRNAATALSRPQGDTSDDR